MPEEDQQVPDTPIFEMRKTDQSEEISQVMPPTFLNQEREQSSEEEIRQQLSGDKSQENEEQKEQAYTLGNPQFMKDREQEELDGSGEVEVADASQKDQFQNSTHSNMFQGFKPGENVKISDILKRDTSILNSSAAGSFLMDQSISGQNMSSHKTQQSKESDEKGDLADKITEELMASLLQSEVTVPQRPGVLGQPNDLNQDVFIIPDKNQEKERKKEVLE